MPLTTITCPCGFSGEIEYTTRRPKHCSPACRQKAYRQRRKPPAPAPGDNGAGHREQRPEQHHQANQSVQARMFDKVQTEIHNASAAAGVTYSSPHNPDRLITNADIRRVGENHTRLQKALYILYPDAPQSFRQERHEDLRQSALDYIDAQEPGRPIDPRELMHRSWIATKSEWLAVIEDLVEERKIGTSDPGPVAGETP